MKKYLFGLTLLMLLSGCLGADNNETKNSTKKDTVVEKVDTEAKAKVPATLQWEESIKVAIAKGKRVNKPVMVMVNRDGCRWCDYMKANALSDPKVVAKLNRNFISAQGFTNRGTVPSDLVTRGTPGTWFIKNGEPMFQALKGATPADQYLEALDIVLKEFKSVKK